MQLTKDNCQVAYCCMMSESHVSDRFSLRLAVKLEGDMHFLSFMHCDSTNNDENENKLVLQRKLVNVAKLFMSQPKPILLVVLSPSFPFLHLQRALEKSNKLSSFYGIVVGVVNALPVLMTKIPSRTRVEQFELPVLVEEVLGWEVTGDWNDMIYRVNVLEKVVTTLTDTSDLIAICDSYAEVFLSGLDDQKLKKITRTFNTENYLQTNRDLIAIARLLGLSHINLKRVFTVLGSTGVENFLNEKERNGELHITENDRTRIQRLRWIEFRKQQYRKEKPFSKRRDDDIDIDVGDEFLVNQAPVDQAPVDQVAIVRVPANRIPVNEYPIWVPYDPNSN